MSGYTKLTATEMESIYIHPRVRDHIAAVEAEKDATIKTLADALEHVSKASVNERVWNDQTGAVDDMQKIVRAALRLAGRMP